MRTPSPTLLLGLALSLLILAGCQAADDTSRLAEAGLAPGLATEPAADEPAADEPAADEPAAEEPAAEEPAAGETLPVESATASGTPAGNADVEFVQATHEADGTWRFDVTVNHPDTGWDDYADGWDVVTPDGRVLKVDQDDPFTRLLLHPHENEQPFTRSQRGLVVPEGVTTVIVRAHDLVHGFGGREIEVDLSLEQGPGFEVSRT